MRAANQGLVMVMVTAEGRVRCNLRLCPPPHWHWCRALPCWRLCVSLVTVPPTATPHPVLGSIIIHHLTASRKVLQHHHHNQLLQYWYLEKSTAIVTFWRKYVPIIWLKIYKLLKDLYLVQSWEDQESKLWLWERTCSHFHRRDRGACLFLMKFSAED